MRPWTRSLVAMLGLVAVVAALVALADATKYRGQQGRADRRTAVTFAVDTQRYRQGHAATALWYTCVGALGAKASEPPDPQPDGTFRAWIRPSLGEDARRRLRGCLHDATIDRVRGRVVAITSEPVGDRSLGPGDPRNFLALNASAGGSEDAIEVVPIHPPSRRSP